MYRTSIQLMTLASLLAMAAPGYAQESAEAPAKGKAQADDDAPPAPDEAIWYEPTANDRAQQPPPAPTAKPKESSVALEIPVYSFSGDIEGWGSSLRLRFDHRAIGVFIGLHQSAGWLDIGGDLNVLGGSHLKSLEQGFDLWVLYPTVGAQLVTNFETGAALGANLTLTGLRATRCYGDICLRGDIRAPSFGVLASPTGLEGVATYWGFGFSGGIGF